MPLQPSLPFEGFASPEAAALGSAREPDPPPGFRAVPPGHFDEAGAGAGRLREPWARFFALLGTGDGGPGLAAGGQRFATLDQHAAAMARQVRENGVTYNVYADHGSARAWPLDLLPFLIAEDDWQRIERGVAQRARLANAIVADVYGAQTLLAKGLLPPALVFGHPGYLRPLKGYRPPDGYFLHIVAVDLVHAADGGWTVMAHRTETPSGMGYALENRLIASALFADAFREMRVKRLPPSFTQLIATLARGADAAKGARPPGDDAVRTNIVLLSPGPYNETYFEHTFLARHLGIHLVEGKELTVRNAVLYLKTLAGLERVDVVLRRLDDVFCDPVELRHDSALGVPGLLQAMRAGNVLVSNVPGSGFLESPALHGFLPGIAGELLGEPLELPGAPTWWCGEAAARRHAFSVLDEALVMPTYPLEAGHAIRGPLVESGLQQGLQRVGDWRAHIEALPDQYTLQGSVPMSHTPVWERPEIGSRAATLRVYAIADGKGGWHVMPGGFTRLAARGQATVSMQMGSSSVDTWVLSSQPVQAPAVKPLPAASPGRRALALSSRAAENLFWAGRYSERAENNVRLCRLVLGSIESSDETDDGALEVIGELTRACGLVPPGAPMPGASLRLFERDLVSALGESSGWTSVGQNLACHVNAAIEIRNRLSNDHWRMILAARNDFADAMAAAHGAPGSDLAGYDRSRVLGALEHLAMQLAAISGAQGDRMTRDEAWRLLFIGRHIERLSTLATFLLVFARHRAILSRSGMEFLLHLFDSTLTYRSLYPGRADMPAMMDQLVIEPSNPRGLYGVLSRLRTKLGQISQPPAPDGAARSPLAALLPVDDALPSWEQLCELGPDGTPPGLIALCRQLTGLMARLSDEVGARYFIHAGAAP